METERALADALVLLQSIGLAVDASTILSRSNRLVVELKPCGLIAKIAPRARLGALTAELAVAAHVGSLAGPIASPARDHLDGPLLGTTVCVSLWERLDPLGPAPEAAIGPAYAELHRALSSFSTPLPDFREPIRQAVELSRLLSTPAVTAEDAALLREIVASHLEAVSSRSWPAVPLHGDPHAGNLLQTRTGSVWIDLESACVGPLEWDLSAMPEHPTWPAHDEWLLGLLRRLRSACVVLWCAAKQDPEQGDLEAIDHHLQSLRV